MRLGTMAAAAICLFAGHGVSAAQQAPSQVAMRVLKVLVRGTDNEAGSLAHTVIGKHKRGELPDKAGIIGGLKMACEHKLVKPRRRRVIIRILGEIGGAETAVLFRKHIGKGSWGGETFSFLVTKSGDLLRRHRPPTEEGVDEDYAVANSMGDLVDALMDLVKDEGGEERKSAIKAVGASGRIEAAPELVKLMRKEPRLRSSIHAALEELGGIKMVADPEAWAGWVGKKLPDEAADVGAAPPPPPPGMGGGMGGMVGGGGGGGGGGPSADPGYDLATLPRDSKGPQGAVPPPPKPAPEPSRTLLIVEIVLAAVLVAAFTYSTGVVGKRKNKGGKGKAQGRKGKVPKPKRPGGGGGPRPR